MRWLGVTLGLLGACVCLVAWIYLRDRDASHSVCRNASSRQPTPPARSPHSEAPIAVGRCAVKLVGRIDSHHWLVRITVRGHSQCLQLDLATFATDQRHGLVGGISRAIAA